MLQLAPVSIWNLRVRAFWPPKGGYVNVCVVVFAVLQKAQGIYAFITAGRFVVDVTDLCMCWQFI